MTHNHSRRGKWTPTYYSWSAMIQRCYNSARNSYANYGGRGIRVCAKWLTFAGFLEDMGERPPHASLDRIDNDRNYEPGNCRWVTRQEQSRNRRNNKLCPVTAERMRDMRAAGVTFPAIGAYFNVSKTMARNVALQRAWA